jgi:hypothetical protein
MQVGQGEIVSRGTSRRRNGKTAVDRLAEGERMLLDRSLGMTQSQLMEKYGYSKRTVQARLNDALNARIAHTVDDYRAQQNAALDEITSHWVDQVEQAKAMINRGAAAKSDSLVERGNRLRSDALNGLTRVGERRAKLNGLDAPTRVEKTIRVVTPIDEEIENLVRESEAMADEEAH